MLFRSLGGAIAVVLGGVILWNPFHAVTTMMQFTGWCMLGTGLWDFLLIVYLAYLSKKDSKPFY